jgi:hypothetical protein
MYLLGGSSKPTKVAPTTGASKVVATEMLDQSFLSYVSSNKLLSNLLSNSAKLDTDDTHFAPVKHGKDPSMFYQLKPSANDKSTTFATSIDSANIDLAKLSVLLKDKSAITALYGNYIGELAWMAKKMQSKTIPSLSKIYTKNASGSGLEFSTDLAKGKKAKKTQMYYVAHMIKSLGIQEALSNYSPINPYKHTNKKHRDAVQENGSAFQKEVSDAVDVVFSKLPTIKSKKYTPFGCLLSQNKGISKGKTTPEETKFVKRDMPKTVLHFGPKNMIKNRVGATPPVMSGDEKKNGLKKITDNITEVIHEIFTQTLAHQLGLSSVTSSDLTGKLLGGFKKKKALTAKGQKAFLLQMRKFKDERLGGQLSHQHEKSMTALKNYFGKRNSSLGQSKKHTLENNLLGSFVQKYDGSLAKSSDYKSVYYQTPGDKVNMSDVATQANGKAYAINFPAGQQPEKKGSGYASGDHITMKKPAVQGAAGDATLQDGDTAGKGGSGAGRHPTSGSAQ